MLLKVSWAGAGCQTSHEWGTYQERCEVACCLLVISGVRGRIRGWQWFPEPVLAHDERKESLLQPRAWELCCGHQLLCRLPPHLLPVQGAWLKVVKQVLPIHWMPRTDGHPQEGATWAREIFWAAPWLGMRGLSLSWRIPPWRRCLSLPGLSTEAVPV